MSRYLLGGAVGALLLSQVAIASGTAPQSAVKPESRAAAAPRAAAPNGAAPGVKPAGGEDEGNRFFNAEVRPILQAKCIACHSGEKPQGGLKLTSRVAILKGGDSGAAVSLTKP